MQFEFATSTRILFGKGTLVEVVKAVQEMGSRALIVTGKAKDRYSRLIELFETATFEYTIFNHTGEPTVSIVTEGLENARKNNIDVVVGIGGGSVLDLAKAIAVLFTNQGELNDYLEVIGSGQTIKKPGIPCIAIPTTAGTGAEVTKNAVLGLPQHKIKVSLRSRWLFPRLAIIDPELTCSLPAHITAQSGMDALTQLIEPYVSNRANPITDAMCREGLSRIARSIRVAYYVGTDISAREDMSLASLLSGMALANAKLGAVHGCAGVLGGMYGAPHGAICARLLPVVMAINLKAMRSRQPNNSSLERYEEIAKILSGDAHAIAEDGVRWVEELCNEFNIPHLIEFGVNNNDLSYIIEKSTHSSSMQGNPIQLTSQEIEEIIIHSL